LAHS
jgi:hypothetical protein